MIHPNYAHAEEAIKAVLPRFPKQWHKQLTRIAKDSFTSWISANEYVDHMVVLYTIKSGTSMYMVHCRWGRPTYSILTVTMDVIHSHGAHAVKMEDMDRDRLALNPDAGPV